MTESGPQTSTGRRRDVAAAGAVLTLLALAVCGSALLGRTALLPESWLDVDPLYRTVADSPPQTGASALLGLVDLTPIAVDLPRDLMFAQQLHHGRLATWNPLSACGAPLWAEQGGPFFPLKLPFYVSPSPRTYAWFLTLRLIAAGIGAYCLGRVRGLPHGPALAAGAMFELSGSMLDTLSFGAASPLCVLPWTLLGATMIARRRDGRAVAGTAVALGVAGLGGHPTLILLVYAAYAVALAAHVAAHLRTPRRAVVIAGSGAVAAVLGAGLAAPALLPLAELGWLSASYKRKPIGAQAWYYAYAISRGVLPVALFAPGALASVHGTLPSHVGAAVLGIGVLGLAIAGLRRLDGALLAVGLFGAALATVPPGFGWIAQLPGLRLLLPYYAWPLVSLSLTQAAGAAVAGFGEKRGRRAVAMGMLLVLAATPTLKLVRDWPTMWSTLPFGFALQQALADGAGRARLVVPYLVAAAALGAAVALRRTAFARWSAAVLVILAVAEQVVLWSTWSQFPRSDVLGADAPPSVRFLQQHLAGGAARFTAQPVTIGHGLTPILYGLADARGVSALPVARYVSYINAADQHGINFTMQALPAARSALLDLAAVRYVVKPRSDAVPPAVLDGDPEMPLVYSGPRTVIYENRAALPRVRIVHRVLPVADADEARQAAIWMAAQSTHAAALGLADAAIVEPAAGHELAPPLAAAQRDETVRITEQSDPDAMILEADLSAAGLVVVADTYYPGWSATIDGTATPIYPANLLFRAVSVPAGRHTIVFRYAPRSLRYGWWIAAAAAATCLALWRARFSAARADDSPAGRAQGTQRPAR
jgi:hypothetical protein